MAIEDRKDASGSYRERLAALRYTETEMGETAALIADIADALSSHPETVDLGPDFLVYGGQRVEARQWPSLRDLSVIIQSWREQRSQLQDVWMHMNADERASEEPPPTATCDGVTRAWL
jgi:hypothetical protein